MEFRKAYGVRNQVLANTVGVSLTKQSEKDACDVNKILYNFKRSGTFSHVNNRDPQYGDLAVSDFQDAMNTVISAQASFDALPSAVRKRFNHSVPVMLDFCADASNRDEAIKLGLVVPPPVQQVVPPAAVVSPVVVPPVQQA